jgi:hypothetical protein
MTSKIDWRRAKRPPRATEDARGSGVVLKNGARTPLLPTDALASRAERAYARWERTLSSRDRRMLDGDGS